MCYRLILITVVLVLAGCAPQPEPTPTPTPTPEPEALFSDKELSVLEDEVFSEVQSTLEKTRKERPHSLKGLRRKGKLVALYPSQWTEDKSVGYFNAGESYQEVYQEWPEAAARTLDEVDTVVFVWYRQYKTGRTIETRRGQGNFGPKTGAGGVSVADEVSGSYWLFAVDRQSKELLGWIRVRDHRQARVEICDATQEDS